MRWSWQEKLLLLLRGGVTVRAGLQPYPPAGTPNPAVPERPHEEENAAQSA